MIGERPHTISFERELRHYDARARSRTARCGCYPKDWHARRARLRLPRQAERVFASGDKPIYIRHPEVRPGFFSRGALKGDGTDLGLACPRSAYQCLQVGYSRSAAVAIFERATKSARTSG